MILDRGGTDLQQFVDLAIGPLLHPVQQEDRPGFFRQAGNCFFVQPEQIGRFDGMFLTGLAGGIASFVEWESDSRALFATVPVDQQIPCDPAQERDGVLQFVRLRAACGPAEHLLRKVGGGVRPDFPPQVADEGSSLVAKGIIEERMRCTAAAVGQRCVRATAQFETAR